LRKTLSENNLSKQLTPLQQTCLKVWGDIIIRKRRTLVITREGRSFESKTWLAKSMNRQLVTKEQFASLNDQIDPIGKMINGYIRSIGDANEPLEPYGDRHNTTDE
jgi:hypothetical protein